MHARPDQHNRLTLGRLVVVHSCLACAQAGHAPQAYAPRQLQGGSGLAGPVVRAFALFWLGRGAQSCTGLDKTKTLQFITGSACKVSLARPPASPERTFCRCNSRYRKP